jgi:hypothetical protein
MNLQDSDKGGRPPFVATKEMRQRVSVAASGGMSHRDIAEALGICRNTLEKNFAAELSSGACERRMEVLQAMFKAAKQGKVAAAKVFLGGGVDAPGKKEQQQAEAKVAQAGSEWEGILKPALSLVKS